MYWKSRKIHIFILFMLPVAFSLLLIRCKPVIASSTALKGISAIKDNSTNMVYYKSGVVSNSTGGVNLIKKDKNKGTTKTLTKVDDKPFYLKDNYIYYTYNKAIYRIKTDGSNKKQLYTQQKTTRLNIIGLDAGYIYYTDYNDIGDVNKLIIRRIQVTGTKNTTIRELTDYNSDTYTLPVFCNNKIYYLTKASGNILSLTSTSPDGKTTKTVIKSATNLSELKGNENGLYYVYQKDSISDYLIQNIDATGKITSLATIDRGLREVYSYPNIKLSCMDDNYLYYTVNEEIYQITYDGINNQLIYNAKNLSNYEETIDEIFVKGNWMIFSLYDGDESGFSTYCMKIDGSYAVFLGDSTYRNSYDILSDTIYYRVVTIPGDDEAFTLNDENIYRKFTLPLKEYE
jgi:uncharacterized protein (DUF779 family)